MYTSSDSDYDLPGPSKRPRKQVPLILSSDSDIPEDAKELVVSRQKRKSTQPRRDIPVLSSGSEKGGETAENRKECTTDRHLRKACPVPGCKTTTGRLAWHIRRFHRDISTKRRLHLCTIATVVQRKPAPASRPKGTPSLPTLFAKIVREEAKKPRITEQQVAKISGTRSFPRFSNDHPMILTFITFLRGLDGRKKSVSESTQIATDVSKYLRYVHPARENPNWLDLLDAKKLRDYLNMLDESGACGVNGQLTKLDRILNGIRYIRIE